MHRMINLLASAYILRDILTHAYWLKVYGMYDGTNRDLCDKIRKLYERRS